jgi:hypothetical protein
MASPKYGRYTSWLITGRVPFQPRITKKHKTNPNPERYIKHDVTSKVECAELEEDELARLEKAASKQDAHTFENILESLRWTSRIPSDFIRAINLALGIGAYTAAQRVSGLGKDHHPDDPQIQKYAHVLAPPKITRKKVEYDPTIRANRNWLMAHGDEYRSKWVALHNGELLDSADSFDELIERVGNSKDILITTVF